jgi:hypothetical protein
MTARRHVVRRGLVGVLALAVLIPACGTGKAAQSPSGGVGPSTLSSVAALPVPTSARVILSKSDPSVDIADYKVAGVSLSQLDRWYDSVVPPEKPWAGWVPCKVQNALSSGPGPPGKVGVQRWWHRGNAELSLSTNTHEGSVWINLLQASTSSLGNTC